MAVVRQIMRDQVISIPPGTSAGEVARLFDDHEISGAPVVDGEGRVVGVVSRTDLVRALAREPEVDGGDRFWEALGRELPTAEDDDPESYFLAPEGARLVLPGTLSLARSSLEATSAEELMTPVAFSVPPDMSVQDAASFLVRGGIHRALVVEGGQLVGIVTAFDLLRYFAEEGAA